MRAILRVLVAVSLFVLLGSPAFGADVVVEIQNGSGDDFIVKDSGGTVMLRVDEATEATTLNNHELFLAGGSTSFTAPVGVTTVYLTMVGGGGGGADGASGVHGGGGGGGAAIVNLPFTVTPLASYTLAVGAGGANETAGGDTIFDTAGAMVTAEGGAGATSTTGASGGGGPDAVGSSGGVASIAGGNGADVQPLRGGGGGGSIFGAGGTSPSSSAVGNPGSAYGGGGSGATAGVGSHNGGAGAAGFCLVSW